MNEGQIAIFFNLNLLFPSEPIPQSFEYLWRLLQNNSLDNHKVNDFVSLTDICMKQICFQIENKRKEQLWVTFCTLTKKLKVF